MQCIIYYLLLLKTIFIFLYFGRSRDRTYDIQVNSLTLCQLSYTTIYLLFSLVSTALFLWATMAYNLYLGCAIGWFRSIDLRLMKHELNCWKKIFFYFIYNILTREGIEPQTFGLILRRSNQLSYLVFTFVCYFHLVFYIFKKW